jgi:phosphoadenosine phosphosulfate reductase
MIGQMQIMDDGSIKDKVDMAIHRLQAFCPEEGYYVAFSGGKDSQCVYHLCKMAGVKFDAHYNVTSVDPPEVIRFIRRNYPDVHFEYPRDKDGKVVTMWNLVPRKQMPPTRLARYCCEWFKESSGKGRVTVTGVRWAESKTRADNQGAVTFLGKPARTKKIADENDALYKINKKGNVILNDDNDENRRMVELCYRTRKTLVNPIVDWEDEDVWQFLNDNGIEHCELYDQGKRRIGCIGCPMNTAAAAADLIAYPAYRRMYIKTFDRMIENNKKNGIKMQEKWTDGEGVMRWWLKQEEEDNNDESTE